MFSTSCWPEKNTFFAPVSINLFGRVSTTTFCLDGLVKLSPRPSRPLISEASFMTKKMSANRWTFRSWPRNAKMGKGIDEHFRSQKIENVVAQSSASEKKASPFANELKHVGQVFCLRLRILDSSVLLQTQSGGCRRMSYHLAKNVP